jgi:protein-disulfide isomerase
VENDPPSYYRRVSGLPITIIAVGAVVAGAFIAFKQVDAPVATPAPVVAVQKPAVAGVRIGANIVALVEDDLIVGSEAAPITVFLFTQFPCPFCQHFFEATWPQIKANYIDTGRVRLVIKFFPVGDETRDPAEGEKASRAAYCAGEQGDFLTDYAQVEGLVKETFMACLTSTVYAEVMAHNIRSALAAGIIGTPAFVINDQLYEGALSYAEFEQLVR